MAANISCGFLKRSSYKRWVSAAFLQLNVVCQSTLTTNENNNIRRFLRQKNVNNLSEDWENWWLESAKEFKAAVTSGNYQSSHLALAVDNKKSVVNETVCTGGGMPIASVKKSS